MCNSYSCWATIWQDDIRHDSICGKYCIHWHLLAFIELLWYPNIKREHSKVVGNTFHWLELQATYLAVIVNLWNEGNLDQLIWADKKGLSGYLPDTDNVIADGKTGRLPRLIVIENACGSVKKIVYYSWKLVLYNVVIVFYVFAVVS